MKQTLFLILFLGVFLSGCHKTTVGYLNTDNASYEPDSLIVKAVLDSVIDKEQITGEIPWQSPTIDGILGTFPIYYSIKAIHCDETAHSKAIGQIKMENGSKITLPYNHTVPPGLYRIDIEVQNEGYSVILNSIFTVIIR